MNATRINQFIQQHQRFGGIEIQIREQTEKVLLVDVSQKFQKLSEAELIQRVEKLFDGELAPEMKLVVQVVERKPSKYFYYQLGGKHYVQRVKYPESTFEIVKGDVGYTFQYAGKNYSLIGEDTDQQLIQASKWLKLYWVQRKFQGGF